MKHLPPFLALLGLAIAAAVGIAVGSESGDAQQPPSVASTCSLDGIRVPPDASSAMMGMASPSETPPFGCSSWQDFLQWKDTDPAAGAMQFKSADDQLPPCFGSWDEAAAHGYPAPDPDVISWSISGPTETPGPPFDMTKIPPPTPFDSWDQVIQSWIQLDQHGFFNVDTGPTPTPELVGSPPLGCSSWQEFIDWMDAHDGDDTPKAEVYPLRVCADASDTQPPIERRPRSELTGDPPRGYASWDEVFRVWDELEQAFGEQTQQPVSQSEAGHAPPDGCSSWLELHRWLAGLMIAEDVVSPQEIDRLAAIVSTAVAALVAQQPAIASP